MMETLALYPAAYIGAAAILGMVVGSFLNVVILRLPARIDHDWRTQAAELLDQPPPGEPPPDIIFPSSRCPKCGHRLAAWENIPVLSFVLLRGHCRACKTGISLQYPLVEILTGVLSAAVFVHFGITAVACLGLILTWTLIVLSGIDIRTQLLPDNITLPLLWLGLLVNLNGLIVPLQEAVTGAMFGYLSLWSVYWVFKLLTGKEGMGYGDFKLLAALGAWLGWTMLPAIIMLSALSGVIIGGGALLLARRGKSVPIPFGPYLAAGGWIALLWGERLIHAYLAVAGLV